MEKTAVQFIFDAVYRDIPFSELLGIIAQAKEMEKQQIIEAFNLGQQEEAKQPFWTKGNEYYEKNF
jgi:hypothetical protein